MLELLFTLSQYTVDWSSVFFSNFYFDLQTFIMRDFDPFELKLASNCIFFKRKG